MTAILITLNQIRARRPCVDGWVKILNARGKITAEQSDEFLVRGEVPEKYSALADDEPFPLVDALNSNDLDDVLWALRCLPSQYRSLCRKLAVWFARRVAHLGDAEVLNEVLDVAWRNSEGQATDEELAAARKKIGEGVAWAWAATWEATVWSAPAAARWSAGAGAAEAAEAAGTAGTARTAERQAQEAKLRQILEAGHWVED